MDHKIKNNNLNFCNSKMITSGWYAACSFQELKKKKIIPFEIFEKSFVIFLTQNGSTHCLDAYCPHMGLHLKTGEVVGEKIRCHFHHWSFDGNGKGPTKHCQLVSGQQKLNSYQTQVAFGFVWIWIGKSNQSFFANHPEMNIDHVDFFHGKKYNRPSHFHISLLNALDIQHVNSVHGLNLKVDSSYTHQLNPTNPEDQSITFNFSGKFIAQDWQGKFIRFLTGGSYNYRVIYNGANVGLLKVFDGLKLFSLFSMPPLYGIFSYRMTKNNLTEITPIFLRKKGKMPWSSLVNKSLFILSAIIYNKVKNDDGEIYENIRFTNNLSAEDQNIKVFIEYLNSLPALDLGT